MKKSPVPNTLSYVWIILAMLAFSAGHARAAVYASTAAGGNWTAGGTWMGGSAPGNWNDHTVNVNGNIMAPNELKGFTAINVLNGKSFTSGTPSVLQDLAMQNVNNFNVTNGNITIYGNLTLENVNLVITSGNLTVTGSLILKGGSTVTFNSTGNINVGSFSTTGSGGTLNVNSGSFVITNELEIRSGTTINISSGVEASSASMSLSNNDNAILNNYGTLTVSGSVSQGGDLNNFGTLNVNGNFTSTSSSSSILTNDGTLTITGDVTFQGSGKIYANPGGITNVEGNVTVKSNENLVIGTSVAPPAYADMMIRGNLVQTNSGDVTINRNGRLAVFGDVTDSGNGGTLFTINNGGQVYVDGDINYSGGGSSITNNNSADPFGLYVGGDINNTGGGTTTTDNYGDEQVMHDTNLPFYNWVNSFSTPLPVTMLYFEARAEQQAVSLTWATASEQNFEKFIIERSANGRVFNKIGETAGAGINSVTPLAYGFTDNAPLTGRSYYRLKIVDLDGSFEYTAIVTVQVAAANAEGLRLYPNPVADRRFTVELGDMTGTPATVRVMNSTGYEVLAQTITGTQSVIELPQSLQAGVYMVQVSGTSGQRMVRMVVR